MHRCTGWQRQLIAACFRPAGRVFPLSARQCANRRPPLALCWVTVGLLFGQALAARVSGPTIGIVTGGFAAPWLLRRRAAARLAGAVLLAIGIGHYQVDARLRPQFDARHVQRFAGQAIEVQGRIAERPMRRPAQTRVVIAATATRRGQAWEPAHGRVLVTIGQAAQPWRRGDRVRAPLQLRHPRNFGNPGEFDYEAYLARRRIYVTAFATDDRAWEREAAPPYGPAALLEVWREGVARTIEETLDGAARQLVAALLIGEEAALGPEIHDRYARAGVSHILSISGLHVGLVATAAYAASRWGLARSERLLLRANVPKLAMATAVAPVVLYAGLAGGSVPTLRSVVMGLLLLFGTLVDRQRDWLTTLAVAALVISLCWPGSLFEISFQLSFMAVLAIVLGMQRVTAWWRQWEELHLLRLRGRRWRVVRWLVLYHAVTLCAVLGTAPLGAWHFNRVSLIAVVANAVVVPLLGLVPISGGLLAVLAVPIAPAVARPLLLAVGLVVRLGDWLVALCAAVPGASLRVVTPTAFELLLLYGVLAALLLRRATLRRMLLAACLVLLGADAAYWCRERFLSHDLRVTFLSVGQGDSTLIEFPGSAVMLIDGGGLSATFDVGERVIAPQLWRRKIGRISYLVLSHPQFDHYGGFPFLLREFAPAALWWNGTFGTGSRFEAFWQAVRERGVDTVVVRRGFRHVIGGVEVLGLAPDPNTRGGANDRSLTLRLRYGPTTLLFPGDLEAEGELQLISAARNALPSTILKVPHHGSRTSSSPPFLDAVAPRLAVISAGYGNRFHMPHSEILAAYRRRGAVTRRTDLDGAVSVRVTADGLISVTTGRPRIAPSAFSS